MSFGYADNPAPTGDLELTFSGEELELVMEAVRAAVPSDDPLGEKIMLRYLTKRVEAQDEKEKNRKRIGFNLS